MDHHNSRKDLFICSFLRNSMIKFNEQSYSGKYPLIVNSIGCQNSMTSFHTKDYYGRADYYLIYLIEGAMDIRYGGGDFSCVTPGSLLILPPKMPYEYHSLPPHNTKYLWAHFTGSYAGAMLERYSFGELPYRRDADLDSNIVIKFQAVLDSVSAQDPYFEAELATKLESILRALARSVYRAQNSADMKIRKSVRHINRHFNTDIRISDLAQMEFLSISRYISVFRSVMGMPPSQYLIRVRLNAACALLQDTEYTVREIGDMVGYRELPYFCKQFKKHTGLSPGEYRSAARSKE